MSNKRRNDTRFSCGHVGLGKFCHRCDQANKMAAKAVALERTHKKEDKAKIVELKNESERLKTVPDYMARLRAKAA